MRWHLSRFRAGDLVQVRSKEEILVRLYEDVMDHTVSSAQVIAAAARSPIDALRELITYRVRYTC